MERTEREDSGATEEEQGSSEEATEGRQEESLRDTEPEVVSIVLEDGFILPEIPISVLKIITYPDHVLRKPCLELEDSSVKKEKFGQFVAYMIGTMYNQEGIGLASPQVGVPLRLFVMDTQWVESGQAQPRVCINPEILEVDSTETVELNEGCLSLVGGLKVKLKRPNEVVLKYTNMKWEEKQVVFTGVEAACVQHEVDHLDGRLILDAAPYWQKDTYRRRIKRAKRYVEKQIKNARTNTPQN